MICGLLTLGVVEELPREALVSDIRPAGRAKQRLFHGLALVAVCLTIARAGAQSGAIGTGGIKGFIHDSAGIGIVGAEITLVGGSQRWETDEHGRFELAKVPAGEQT